MSPSIAIVYGTRPEAIKLAPVIRKIQDSSNHTLTCVSTGQHLEMLQQVHRLFDITPDIELSVYSPNQNLNTLFSKTISRLDNALSTLRPDAIVCQGDTTSVAAAAITGFYREIPIIHLEAGLRSGDLASPFPEEANRRIVSQVTSLHLAPTRSARTNLENEGVRPETIAVTGNTVIDALFEILTRRTAVSDPATKALLESGRPFILVTLHRRENWGSGVESIARALKRVSLNYPALAILIPAHSNPIVGDTLRRLLSGAPNITITRALPYADFVAALANCRFVVTDSGGVQEEAPSLGKPVLVVRETTERTEAIEAGTVRLIGTHEETVFQEISSLFTDIARYETMATSVNPYGDGHAANRVLAAVDEFFGLGTRLPDFQPS